MIEYYLQRIKDNELKTLSKFEKGCWINIINPNVNELKYLSKEFNLNYELLEEGLDENELPRHDFENNIDYIYIKTLNNNNENITLLIALTDTFILTFSKENNKLITEILKKKNFITTQKKKAILELLNLNNSHFENLVAKIMKNLNNKKVSTKNLKDKDIESLLENEEILNSLVSTYTYTLHLYNKLIKKIKFYDKDQDLIDDLIIDLEEALNICTNSLKTISNLRNYQNLLLSNRLNKTITILTIFTIFISIPTAISGFYGMNVYLPLQNNPFTYIFVLILTVILITIFVLILKRKKIL